jgi:3-hydroxyisobutyrate dehydrogenase-like beta-hydroxyacid dehydrogenase
MKVGLLGTGKMGSAIVERLMACGHEVAIWNRSVEKTVPLAQKGAVVAKTPAELVNHSEMVISILTDASAIDACYRGPNGVLSSDIKGKLFIRRFKSTALALWIVRLGELLGLQEMENYLAWWEAKMLMLKKHVQYSSSSVVV